MSYFHENSMSVDHGERTLREHVNYNECKLELTKPAEIPADAFEGWEHYNEYHICWICGKQGHESDMIRNKLHYWVHGICQDTINNNAKNICDENRND